MKTLHVHTRSQTDLVNITPPVQSALDALNLRHGLIMIFIPHTTAGITINENADPDVVTDIKSALERMVPRQQGFRHAEGNAAAHVKAMLTGFSVQVPVENGHLKLGTWQGIFLCEFDGPRTRSVWLTPIPAIHDQQE